MRSSSSAGFDPRSFDPRTFDLREAVDGLRDAFARGAGGRSSGPAQHDLRGAILTALQGGAKNGHQVMQALAAAHAGWMPAASEVYPTLQQLVDEGLVTPAHDGERTVYALTEAGRAAADEHAAQHAAHHAGDHEARGPWGVPRWNGQWSSHWSEADAAVPKAGAKLAQAAAQVAQSGTKEQKERAAALLDETRRKLYALLAEG